MKSEQELNYLMGIIEGAMNNSIDPLKSFLKKEIKAISPEEAAAVTTTAIALGRITFRRGHESLDLLRRDLRTEIVHTLNESSRAECRRR